MLTVMQFSTIFVMCSCYGQNLETSTYVGETVFSIVVCIGGLILFSHLIGKMQVWQNQYSILIRCSLCLISLIL